MENKLKKIIFFVIILIYSVIFFSYNITLTWDSSEYIGLAQNIGTEQMQENWIGHRGIMFPMLIKMAMPFGIQNKYFILSLMYIFYIIMISAVWKIYKTCQKEDFIKEKYEKIIYFLGIICFILLNYLVFGYFHTFLTEFVSIAIAIWIVYLSWKWSYINWSDSKKKCIIYVLIFSLLSIFLYHIKQSLLPIALIPIIITSLISIINNHKKENILYRIFSNIIVWTLVIITIIIWNFTMKNANVAEKTNNARVRNRLICGIEIFDEYANETTLDKADLSNLKIDEQDKEEILKIYENKSEYKKFTVYSNSKNEYFVFFTKEDYSFSEQLKFYIKLLVNSPDEIFKNYLQEYFNIIFIEKEYPISFFKENYVIPNKIYNEEENIVDVNPDYEEYIENYRSQNNFNVITKVFNKIIKSKYSNFITVFTKINLWILPSLLIFLIVFFIVVRKKYTSSKIKILEFILILYSQTFLYILILVVMGAIIDRYFIPVIIPMYIGDLLLFILTIKLLKEKFTSKKMYKLLDFGEKS